MFGGRFVIFSEHILIFRNIWLLDKSSSSSLIWLDCLPGGTTETNLDNHVQEILTQCSSFKVCLLLSWFSSSCSTSKPSSLALPLPPRHKNQPKRRRNNKIKLNKEISCGPFQPTSFFENTKWKQPRMLAKGSIIGNPAFIAVFTLLNVAVLLEPVQQQMIKYGPQSLVEPILNFTYETGVTPFTAIKYPVTACCCYLITVIK